MELWTGCKNIVADGWNGVEEGRVDIVKLRSSIYLLFIKTKSM